MCGLCGVVSADPRWEPAEDELAPMLGALHHRGPDDRGTARLAGAALGHARLSILDLSPAGRQPMANEDGTVWAVFNGEIYNYLELREDLQRRGHRFRSATDGEVLVHLYEEKGEDLLHDLRGMFALALWDESTRTLLLARDRLGKKPLAYRAGPAEIAFASELAALVSRGERRPDLEAIHHYLTFQYVPAPLTAFRGVRRLGAGEVLRWRAGSMEVRRWWRPRALPRSASSLAEAAERLEGLLDEAVRLRLRSDVPVGAFLSGGLDSSLVVALMARHGPVRTFSVGFEEDRWNELPWAREVARRFGASHHEVVVRPSAAEVLPTLVRHYGDPFADPAALPTFYLSRHTAGWVKVALTGDGGDEAFAGYDRYRGLLLGERLPRALSLLGRGPWRAGRFLRSLALPPAGRYFGSMAFFDDETKDALYSREMRMRFGASPSFALMAGWFSEAESGHWLDRMISADLRYLADGLLVKADIASMACSLELRSPLLDHRLVEFALALPPEMRVRGGTGKWLLRKVAGRWLPSSVLRRRKQGFEVPLERWFREDLRPMVEEVVLGPRALERGYFDPAGLRRLVDEHLSGARDHANRLWALLMLELWHRELVDPPALARAAGA